MFAFEFEFEWVCLCRAMIAVFRVGSPSRNDQMKAVPAKQKKGEKSLIFSVELQQMRKQYEQTSPDTQTI